MTQGFQQQNRAVGFCIPKSAPSPQHGQKFHTDKTRPPPASRSFEPKPTR